MANVEINGLAARTPATTDEVEVQQTAGGASGKSTWAQVITLIAANLPADTIDAITEIAAALKTGSDGTLVTGTAGTSGNLASWDANGDAIDSAIVAANVITTANAASVSASGIVELATTAEIDTATDAARAMSPDAFSASDFGLVYAQVTCFDYTTNTAVGDGAGYFATPSALAGYDLVEVHAEVITAGTTGTTDIQIHNVTQAADVLTTKLTIDSAETGSDTAATAAVIDGTQDDITANDLLRIDVDAISTTPAQGLIVTMGFRKP